MTTIWRGPASLLARYGPLQGRAGRPGPREGSSASRAAFALASLALLHAPWPATAAEPAPSPPASGNTVVAAPAGDSTGSSEPGFTTGLWTRSNLLGDMFGLRTWMARYGLSLGIVEISEALGNVTGGVERGFEYEGLTTMTLQLDTSKALGWEGGTFNASALQIHGRNLSAEHLDNLQTASGIEAARTTRLWELWYQQSFLEGRFDIKGGQQSIDQEFISSQYSALFVNTMMGWPMVPSVDLYAGGPAYPLSSLGIRARGQPGGNVTLLGGVFDDNPPGGPFDDDSQLRGAEASGAKFHLGTGALFIGEIQYALNQPTLGQMDTGERSAGLPGTYRLGAWFDTARFPDQRFDNIGLSLANPKSTGIPAMHSHNFSLYGVADQTIWQPDPQSPRALSVFARLMGAPGDRNLVDFSVNAGVTLKAPFEGRDNDTVGLGFGLAKVSGRTAALDRDTAILTGTPVPRRSTEEFIELTYQFQIAPWWQVQPDFQYVFNPGGGILNPNTIAVRLHNEAIIGMRTIITF